MRTYKLWLSQKKENQAIEEEEGEILKTM